MGRGILHGTQKPEMCIPAAADPIPNMPHVSKVRIHSTAFASLPVAAWHAGTDPCTHMPIVENH